MTDCETSGCLSVDLELEVRDDECVRFRLLRSVSLCPCAILHLLSSLVVEKVPLLGQGATVNTTIAVFCCPSRLSYCSSQQLRSVTERKHEPDVTALSI